MRDQKQTLEKFMSPLGAWAFSIGASVGWGSLVVTSSTYLAQSGPAGSVLGLIAATLIMLVIARNYAYLMRVCPESGGAYTFMRDAFGYDQGFLAAWFVAMTYFAVLWANITSLPLFSRIFMGGMFRFGKLYTIFGYEVFVGEMLLSIAAVVIVGLISIYFKKFSYRLVIAMALIFTAGVFICFAQGFFSAPKGTMSPAYLPDASALRQIINITVVSPWAFIGFESISHGTEEFSFNHTKIGKILTVSVISTTALYVMIILLSVTAYPEGYGSWLEYIRDLDNLSGIEALPAFYAASRYLGNAGVMILMISLLALVFTSIVILIFALSRLIYSLAADRVLPAGFAELNREQVPVKAMLFVIGVSCLIPFVGRTAIGWIVDVTTIGATLIYAFISAAVIKMADVMEDSREKISGRAGLLIMIAFGVYILVPNIITKGGMAKETYFLFIVWSILGFLFFRYILRRDREKRFGNSIIVWVAILALVLLVSLIWMRQSMIAANEEMTANVQHYYEQVENNPQAEIDEQYVESQIDELAEADTRTMLMAIAMFGFALFIMLNNHSYMSRRQRESEMLASTDSMTGVKNKHAYMLREKELDEAIDGGYIKDFSVVVCDVNGLKKINDTLGHKAGDEYICAASSMICEIFQHSPVFRIGGDEFLVILTGRDYSIREQLMAVLHDSSVNNIAAGGAVVSGGISDFDPGKDKSFNDVFARADVLMYEEKKLLKEMGSISRDDEPEEDVITAELRETAPIISIRRHILIVDDEEVNRLMLGAMLAGDYEILHAADGLEAMNVLEERCDDIALILLDLRMPHLDGTQVLRNIRSNERMRSIPVIVLTSDQGAEVECLRIGAVDFIPKPYPDAEIVRARVDRSIELSEDKAIIQSTERDNLTRLFNIDYFLRYVNLFDQHYEDMSMDALVVDISRFHLLNERYGKNYGDTVLRRVGERIRKTAREISGVGARQSADTFYIYCPHIDDYKGLLDKMADGLDKESGVGRIRLRMGVYSNVDKTLDIERRFDRARAAANNVRDNFADPVGIYDDEMHRSALYKERLLEEFRPAVQNGQFLVYFQPKFDVRGDKPVLSSAEALVRWNHPELGMISPGVFIPLLEEIGLILELDRFVWEDTALRIKEWKAKFGRSVPVSVNVSRIDMLMPDLTEIFGEILERNGLTTDDIILEITESAYTGDSEQVISTAKDLRGMGMGFRIEMDDFGTGYSSLGMLSNLPVDVLKLDMSFVRSAFGETRDVRIIELIIDIADYLNVPVVAEGVETEEQYLTLKEMGCDYMQGYYFSKPLPREEFERFIEERLK